MGLFLVPIAMIFAGFVGVSIYETKLVENCNQIKVIEMKDVRYKCEVLPDQSLNWTPSKAQ